MGEKEKEEGAVDVVICFVKIEEQDEHLLSVREVGVEEIVDKMDVVIDEATFQEGVLVWMEEGGDGGLKSGVDDACE